MVYGLETVAVTKKQVEEMEVAEMKMLRFAMGVTRKDKIRNKHIRSTVKVEQLGMKMREGRLRWYGHVMRRDQEYVGRKMMEMELPGKRKRGRPKNRFLDVVKEDMGEVGAKETDVKDRKMWRMMIHCRHPRLKGKPERRRRSKPKGTQVRIKEAKETILVLRMMRNNSTSREISNVTGPNIRTVQCRISKLQINPEAKVIKVGKKNKPKYGETKVEKHGETQAWRDKFINCFQ